MNENDMCCAYADPNAILIDKLQEMLEKAEGEDKCVICNAIEKLRAPKSTGMNFALIMLLAMFTSTNMDSTTFESMMQILKTSMPKENNDGSSDTES